jgi:hypothetical protein
MEFGRSAFETPHLGSSLDRVVYRQIRVIEYYQQMLHRRRSGDATDVRTRLNRF